MLRKIFYIIPNYTKPCGGILTRYQHCMFLNELGFEAYPLHMGNFKIDWFKHNLKIYSIDEIGYKLHKNDVVVANEVFPYQGLKFKNCIKVMFVQGIFTHLKYQLRVLDLLNRWIIKIKNHLFKINYIKLGYDYIITNSGFVTLFLKDKMNINTTTITNGIDHSKFFYDPTKKIKNTILWLPRKNREDSEKIKNIVNSRIKSKNINFISVDGLKQEDLIKEYQKADIFLATSYPEGFGRPPLEAMACGCAVVGFTGGGAKEFMIDEETAMVAEDGDCETAAMKLLKLIQNPELKERIRKNGIVKAKEYTLERMKNMLKDFYEK